jgi:hypothetical protein
MVERVEVVETLVMIEDDVVHVAQIVEPERFP